MFLFQPFWNILTALLCSGCLWGRSLKQILNYACGMPAWRLAQEVDFQSIWKTEHVLLFQGLLVKGSPAFCTSNVALFFFSCARQLNKILSACCCLLSVAAVDACKILFSILNVRVIRGCWAKKLSMCVTCWRDWCVPFPPCRKEDGLVSSSLRPWTWMGKASLEGTFVCVSSSCTFPWSPHVTGEMPQPSKTFFLTGCSVTSDHWDRRRANSMNARRKHAGEALSYRI